MAGAAAPLPVACASGVALDVEPLEIVAACHAGRTSTMADVGSIWQSGSAKQCGQAVTQSACSSLRKPFAMANDEFEGLVEDFGRRPSIARRLLYIFFAVEAVAAATLFFVRVFLIDVNASPVTLVIGALVSVVILSMSYHNLAFARAARIRRTAVPPTRSAYKGQADGFEKAKARFEGRISSAALWYSCAYNNALFMVVAPFLGLHMLADKLGGDLNLLVSGAAAASLALFNSKSAMKAIGE